VPFPEPAKVNFSLSTKCRHTGGAEADHSFLTLAQDGGEWLTANPSWLYPQDRTPYPLSRRLSGPQSSLDLLEELKICCPFRI